MNRKSGLEYLFKKKQFEEIENQYLPNEIAALLPLKDGLRIAYRLLYNNNWDDNMQEYAVSLLNELRIVHSTEWNKSWEYDALLGLACDITGKHDERYEAYNRAFERIKDPPPRLLIELARCCICPDPPPFSYDYAIGLVMKAMKDVTYTDGVSLLCNLYSLKWDDEKKDYWSNVLQEMDLKGENVNSPLIEPRFLVDEYLKDIKEQ